MASGLLGKANLAANTNTTVYTVPASTLATVNVNLVNAGTSTAKVRIAMAATGTPGASEYIEYDFQIAASQVLERTGIVMSAGERVVVFSDLANVAVRVHGFEEAA